MGGNRLTQHKKKHFIGWKIGAVVLLFGIIVILIGVVAYVFTGHFHLLTEASYVNKAEYQAVYVNQSGSNGGQTYFGHIASINNKYLVLDNVFYLQPGKTDNQMTLNNLSCAVYSPNDQIIINRPQVSYWENMVNTGQVTQQINKWYSQNISCTT